MNDIKMTSGFGQFHTNEPDLGKPDKKLTPYASITWAEIQALVDHPQQVEKPRAQWLIPSPLPSRSFKDQEARGQFFMLWADLDDKPPTLPDLAEKLEIIIGACNYEIYNTSSATPDNQKARLLIPLQTPLNGTDWMLAQETLGDFLESLRIKPDRAAERPAQLCYLPNKGKFYGSLSQRDGIFFDPRQTWANEIAAKRNELEAEQAERESAKQAQLERRAALQLSGTIDPFLRIKETFNAAYSCEELLEQAGYCRKGNRFRHPHSETGNFSATVKDGRVHALSSNDPLYSEIGAHDAFSIFTTLHHGGDNSAALKHAGNNLLTIGVLSYNKAVQMEYAKKKADQQHTATNPQPEPETHNIDYSTMPDEIPVAAENKKVAFSMSEFSLRGRSEAMKLKMLADRFVLDRIAILGQATTIYAKPNTGKTLLVLWMLKESIKNGYIKGEDVFYINADDDYKGLVFKTSMAEQYGFEMLAPGHNGFESAALQGYMRQMIDDDTARGKVIILDTLKKFTDLMNKKAGSEFMNRAREFVAHGGTLIMLAHTNKNRDLEGKAVFGGTSDIVDDCDCVFMLDEVAKTATTKQVLFENIKSRGDVANELAFSYSIEEGRHYQHRLDSVEPADKAATEQAKKDRIAADAKEKNSPAIDAITEAIEQGNTLKTELIEAAHDCSGISKRKLTDALNKYMGTNVNAGALWREEVGAKNAKSYHLLSTIQATAQDYSFFKDGE